jgi:hypothetical protein
MINFGPMYFYTGVPDSKVATLPSYPRKGKEPAGENLKPGAEIKRFLWGGFTVEIKHKENDE